MTESINKNKLKDVSDILEQLDTLKGKQQHTPTTKETKKTSHKILINTKKHNTEKPKHKQPEVITYEIKKKTTPAITKETKKPTRKKLTTKEIENIKEGEKIFNQQQEQQRKRIIKNALGTTPKKDNKPTIPDATKFIKKFDNDKMKEEEQQFKNFIDSTENQYLNTFTTYRFLSPINPTSYIYKC